MTYKEAREAAAAAIERSAYVGTKEISRSPRSVTTIGPVIVGGEDAVDAALSAFSAAGWELVPRVPTEEMIEKADQSVDSPLVHLSAGYFRRIWASMIEASHTEE